MALRHSYRQCFRGRGASMIGPLTMACQMSWQTVLAGLGLVHAQVATKQQDNWRHNCGIVPHGASMC